MIKILRSAENRPSIIETAEEWVQTLDPVQMEETLRQAYLPAPHEMLSQSYLAIRLAWLKSTGLHQQMDVVGPELKAAFQLCEELSVQPNSILDVELHQRLHGLMRAVADEVEQQPEAIRWYSIAIRSLLLETPMVRTLALCHRALYDIPASLFFWGNLVASVFVMWKLGWELAILIHGSIWLIGMIWIRLEQWRFMPLLAKQLRSIHPNVPQSRR